MKAELLRLAEAYCNHVALRDQAAHPHPEYGTAQDALVWAMFYLWAAENLEDV